MTVTTQPLGAPLPNWQPCPRPSGVTLQGRYCCLERLNPAQHAQMLYQAIQTSVNDNDWTYLPYGPFATFESYNTWLASVYQLDDPFFYAVIDQQTHKAVGVASLLRIDPPNGVIEVGHIYYSPLLQRTIAATEAMYLLMKHCFELGYRRYEWKCNSLNAPSCRAALRLGFSFEGIFRQAAVVKGHNRDTAWYSLLDTEWPKAQQAFEQWLAPSNFIDGQQQRSLQSLRAALS